MNNSILKFFKWVGIIILGAFVVIVIIRIPVVMNKKATEEAVAKIHATKLTLDDVEGKDLVALSSEGHEKTGAPDYNATVAGIDANGNGIRDDVEQAIFNAYPQSLSSDGAGANNARTRAVLLQYALALQMEMTQTIVNTETVTAVIENKDRALNCIWSISSRADMKKFIEETDKNEKFVEKLQINNDSRKKYQEDFYKYLGSYSSPNNGCDLDLSKLPN